MDANKTIEKLGSDPLVTLMKSIGKWNISNVFGVWDPEKWDFQTTLATIHNLEMGALFNVWVSTDDTNSSRNILEVCIFSFALEISICKEKI